jgi:pSer/pThr/pTyr-binding forkhead associated (FHA) protein
MMNLNFDRLEKRLQALFEENLPSIFIGKKPRIKLIDRLIIAMQENTCLDEDNLPIAPDQYILNVPPGDLYDWQQHQDTLNLMADILNSTGSEEGLQFNAKPTIQLRGRTILPEGQFSIDAIISEIAPDKTDTITVADQTPDELQINPLPKDAMLIIQGKTAFVLDKPVINIGRHSDNDLVLDDPYISRHHAQLRAIHPYFVIFDVGSLSGLVLNGKKVTKATLQAGDVIKIGDIFLIYNQDTTSAQPTRAMLPEDEDKLDTDGDK